MADFKWGERSAAAVYSNPDGSVILSIGGDEPGKPYEYLEFTGDEWERFLAFLVGARA